MKKLVQLVNEWDSFDAGHSNASLEDFCRYYLAKTALPSQNQVTLPNPTQAKRVTLLRTLGRTISAYTLFHKAAMSKTSIPSPEGFYFLTILRHAGELKKTDLINYLLMEYTTGMEAINKLLKDDLIEQRSDENDKRAKLIRLTPKGTTVLNECFVYAGKAQEMFFHQVPDDTVQLCASLLSVLDTQNSELAIEMRTKDFNELYERFKKSNESA